MTQCSICLSSFRDPVCIPCGHVYCKRCLTDYANAPGNNGLTAKCPECRASFDLVVPDLTYLPEKYHKFVSHNIRRVYVDFSSANKELRESLRAAEDRLARKASMEQALLKRCEELTEALNAHRQGERDANQRILELEGDISTLENIVQENGSKVKDLQRMHGLIVDKMKCVERSNQVLQNENVRLSLNYHDAGVRLKEKDPNTSIRDDTLSNQPPDLYFAQSTSVVSLPKQKQRRYIIKGPTPSNTECPTADSMSTTTVPSVSTSRSLLSRPIKPLPKRRAIKTRLIGDSPFIPIGVSDFV